MPRSNKILTAGGFLAFFVFGFVDNLKGPLLPQLLQSGEFSYRQGGTILLAGYIGFIAAALATGVLADVVSNRRVLCLAGVCLCVGCIGFGSATAYTLLILCMGVIGIGLGAIELGGNGLIVQLHRETRGRYLNLLATFHGLGSLIVPLYAAWLLSLDFNWQTIYCLCAVIAAPLIAVFMFDADPATARLGAPSAYRVVDGREVNTLPDRTEDLASWDWRLVRRTAFTRQMWAYYALISCYVAAELGLAAWMVEFLQQERAQSVAVSSLFLSAFFGMLVLGRLLGAVFVESFGYTQAIAVSLIGSSFCLAAGIFGNSTCVYLLPISGLFMSIVFPTIAAIVSELHRDNVGTVLGILFAFAGLGGGLGPWTIGWISDVAGLQMGIGCTVLFSIMALFALGALRR